MRKCTNLAQSLALPLATLPYNHPTHLAPNSTSRTKEPQTHCLCLV